MNRHPFDLLMELDSRLIRLDCAALHLARDVQPHLDLPAYLAQLDALAAQVGALRPGLAANLRYQALHQVLVGQHEFRGNRRDYYDPDNSYLNRVLDRHVGVPISLGVVWIEVARRLKWPVAGVRFPGHFLVRIDDAERVVLVDPFNRGRSLSLRDCQQLLQRRFGQRKRFSAKYLRPAGTRAILARLLGNLRLAYLSRQDWGRLSAVLRRLAAVQPGRARHLQELAAIRYRQGDLRGAYAHLAVCLQRFPHALDRPLVQRSLRRLERVLAALN